jgi:hypothetical protein
MDEGSGSLQSYSVGFLVDSVRHNDLPANSV